jgi:hypothetical protein
LDNSTSALNIIHLPANLLYFHFRNAANRCTVTAQAKYWEYRFRNEGWSQSYSWFDLSGSFLHYFPSAKQVQWERKTEAPFKTCSCRSCSSWSRAGASKSLRVGIWKVDLDPSGSFFWRIMRRTISARLTIRQPINP